MKPHSFDASRRVFLRHAGALSALGSAAAPLALNLSALGSAAAQSASDYKALVCIFLFGGNDALNMVLPTDADSWSAYTRVRNQAPDSIALLAPGTAPLAGAAAGSPARLGGVLCRSVRRVRRAAASRCTRPWARCRRCSTPTGGSPSCPTSARS